MCDTKYDPFVWLAHTPWPDGEMGRFTIARRLSEIARLEKHADDRDRTVVTFTDGTFILSCECFDVIHARLNRLIDQGRPVR